MTETLTIRTVDGASLAVYLDGPADAPVLTFTHSLAATSAMWAPQVQALAESFRIARIDFRGHGGSSIAPAPDGFGRLAADVVAVWDALGVARSHYVGLSLGGIVGAGLGLNHGERLDRLVLADCRFDAVPGYLELWRGRSAQVDAGGTQAIAAEILATWLTAETRAANPTLAAELLAGIEATDDNGWRNIVAMFPTLDYKKRLGEIDTPTMFLCGSEDVVCEEMRDCAGRVRDAQFSIIQGAAHVANLDQPQAFNELLAQFLGVRTR
ncbi:MAG: alpha/beta fold hydrolase [Novosphingobium sp.]